MTILYKQNQSKQIVDVLESCHSGGWRSSLSRFEQDAIYALALRIGGCSEGVNIYTGADMLNRETGELYDGHGILWFCQSRFCAFCIGRQSKINRKKIRFAFENERLFVGEDWFFITYTMPDLSLKGFTLEKIAAIMQTAWAKFSHVEPNENKSQTWFQNHFRGGFKSYEFTYTKHETFHFHLHSLSIGRRKIRRNNFVEIRREWTNALKFAFRKHGVKWECNTGDGLAVVNVQSVAHGEREKAVLELSKYVTKSDSWLKIPVAEIAQVAFRSRSWRLFESFGSCRETVREMKETPVKQAQKVAFDLLYSIVQRSKNGYLDTTLLFPSVFAANMSPQMLAWANAPPKRRKRSWFRRILENEISLPDYADELNETIAKAINFRKVQLRRLHPFATFKTLNGWAF